MEGLLSTVPTPSSFYSRTLADEALYYSTIYPNSRHRRVGWPSATPHVGWLSGLRPSAKPNHVVCSLAYAGGYDRPCGPIKSLFLLIPARCLVVGPDYTALSCPTATVWPLVGQSQGGKVEDTRESRQQARKSRTGNKVKDR